MTCGPSFISRGHIPSFLLDGVAGGKDESGETPLPLSRLHQAAQGVTGKQVQR